MCENRPLKFHLDRPAFCNGTVWYTAFAQRTFSVCSISLISSISCNPIYSRSPSLYRRYHIHKSVHTPSCRPSQGNGTYIPYPWNTAQQKRSFRPRANKALITFEHIAKLRSSSSLKFWVPSNPVSAGRHHLRVPGPCCTPHGHTLSWTSASEFLFPLLSAFACI